ncbi:30S ribosomal protein S5 [Candidatus Campbellbacteria bacterium]|nr:MAG: 30S ribosomal protein S5 [Candidatus Campbellbacteria bacterium]
MTEDKNKNENLENQNLDQKTEQNDTPKESKEEKVVENKEEVKTTSENENKEEKTKSSDKKDFKGRKPFDKNRRFNNKRGGKFRRPFRREKPEFEQKILSLRRVTRVMAGGRRFSFSVAVVVGDKKGRVGIGLGKSNDTTMAIDKAVRNAKKNMVRIKLNKDGSIPYDVSAKYKASEVNIRPVKGKGLAAGGAVRTVLEYAGVKEAGAKLLTRSKNHINNAWATIIALEPFSEKVEVSLQKEDRRNPRGRKGGRFNKKGGFNKGGFNKGRKPFVKREDKPQGSEAKPETTEVKEKTEAETVENNSNK